MANSVRTQGRDKKTQVTRKIREEAEESEKIAIKSGKCIKKRILLVNMVNTTLFEEEINKKKTKEGPGGGKDLKNTYRRMPVFR